MRVVFKDGSVVEYPMASTGLMNDNTLILTDLSGEIFAELNREDVEAWNAIIS